jgi:hypothetical protein
MELPLRLLQHLLIKPVSGRFAYQFPGKPDALACAAQKPEECGFQEALKIKRNIIPFAPQSSYHAPQLTPGVTVQREAQHAGCVHNMQRIDAADS